MTEDMVELLLAATRRLEQAIADRHCPAVVVLHGDQRLLLSDYDYLHDLDTAVAFERRAAAKAREIDCQRWVFAVPMIWSLTADRILTRPVTSRTPVGEGEREVIEWTAFDPADGVDYGYLPYTRRPDGEPIFGESEIVTATLHPDPRKPGAFLMREMLADDDPSNA